MRAISCFALCLVVGGFVLVSSMTAAAFNGAGAPSVKPSFSEEPNVRVGQINVPSPRPKGIQAAQGVIHVLSRSDEQLYKAIFKRQKAGDFKTADQAIAKLSDRTLMGHVLYQRYMHPNAYTSSYKELSRWLRSYKHLPNADIIYKLAQKKSAGQGASLTKPVKTIGTSGSLELTGGRIPQRHQKVNYTPAEKQYVSGMQSRVRSEIARGQMTTAWTILNTEKNIKTFSKADFSRLQGDIALKHLFHGDYEIALKHAVESANRSAEEAPTSAWVAGLLNWRNGRAAKAAKYFEMVAYAPTASSWMSAAGSYWAYRAHKKSGQRRTGKKVLQIASQYPYTFYGVIARETLKKGTSHYKWDTLDFTDEHHKNLAKTKRGHRGLALLQIGQTPLAELELKRMQVDHVPILKDALLALTYQEDMPSLALQLAGGIRYADGRLIDPALYPLIPWSPNGGFNVDRALIQALVRQESRFDPTAKSGSGAVGLMQLMPTTASYVAEKPLHLFKTRSGEKQLLRPEYNLSLGQLYVRRLLNDKRIDGNLFKLLIGYNAGPGRMSRWIREIDFKEDPLLFIEMIPSHETRVFVERVMTNYWIYRIRLNQDLPSLKAVARDKWPVYQSQDQFDKLAVAQK